mgnify:CR=1 FL=1
MKWLKRILWVLTGIMIAVIVAGGWYLFRAVPIGAGYAAKYLCSSVFISGRNPETVFHEDIEPINPLARVIRPVVNRQDRSVTAVSLGLFKTRAIYREGCGCTLVVGTTDEALRSQAVPRRQLVNLPDDRPWPMGDAGPTAPLPAGIDPIVLEGALNRAFAEPGPRPVIQTRALVVVYRRELIAERYAPGFHKDIPMPGWSMSKTVTNALVGILVKKAHLRLAGPAPVPEWQAADDPRRNITLDQLLRMSSGLEFEEVYEPLYDATDMLYGSADFAAFAAAKPPVAAPDAQWSYSSGTSNIVSRIVRTAIGGNQANYLKFIYRELFDRIGMTSAVVELDPSGTVVGSSYTVATARDWAKFGLLYLQDGVWKGERIFPEGWVNYSTTPTPMAPNGRYGAHVWLNAGTPSNPGNRRWPRLPRDMFLAQGFQGQRLIVVPSRDLVVVRLGLTLSDGALDLEQMILDILRALPPAERST